LCFLNANREPRGFAFVEFLEAYDASEAQYHMNHQIFGGREITVVLAAESRKRPEQMRKRTKVRYVFFFLIWQCALKKREFQASWTLFIKCDIIIWIILIVEMDL
jgi:RNA recognition motif-containing protein